MTPFPAFARGLVLLAVLGFVERVVFASHHAGLSANLALWEVAAALARGVRFDLALAAGLALVAYLPAWLLSRLTPLSFASIFRAGILVAATAMVLVHGADLLYFEETERHLGYELKEGWNSGGELFRSAITTYAWSVALQLVLLPVVWFVAWKALPTGKVHERRMFGRPRRWYHHLAPEGQLLVVMVAAVLLVRGGLQSVPLEPLHAQAAGDHRRASLALNGAYNAAFSSITPYGVERVLKSAPTEAQKALVAQLYGSPAIRQALPAATQGPAPNVVILFLESWSASYMGSYGHPWGTTPFFDELRSRSLTTREMLAGGHRTTEGLFATLCSAQNPLGATVAQSQLQNYGYDCLPRILKGRGYRTAFFQGTVSGTSGTGAFVQQLGFEQSYGKEHVSSHRLPHNSWGLHDPDLYDFALEKMGTLPQPFLVGINTNSTHDHQLPPGTPEPFDGATRAGRYGNALHFADGALRAFVETLMQRHPNTILVALSDHAGAHDGPVVNGYRIPFLIHAPGRVFPTTLDTVATQRDVAPTLLDLLGLAPAEWFSGLSLMEEPRRLGADYYHAGMLGWIEGDTGIEVALREPTALRCFTARGDFAPLPCAPDAPDAARRALAITTVLQELLFSGRLSRFADYRRFAPQTAAGDAPHD